MNMKIKPLPGQSLFGAIVTGLHARDIEDPAVRTQLLDLWIRAGVIVFRGLESSEANHLALSRVFGPLETHPLFKDTPGRHPELINLVYTPDKAHETYEVDGKRLGSWLPWHSDLIYTDRINHGGILRPLMVPDKGGETGFIDRIAAYAALSDDLKARIEGVEVLYIPNFDATLQRYGRDPSVHLPNPSDQLVQLNAIKRPRVIHPLVYVQAETGRKVLNISPWFADGIVGMEEAEGAALLEEVIQACVKPALAYFHRWRAEDMVLWDNWRMLHCATGVPIDGSRHMQRTTITGDYALGRVENPEDAFPEALRISV